MNVVSSKIVLPLVAFAFMEAACSKALTPKRGAALAEEYINKQNPRIAIGPLAAWLGHPQIQKASEIPALRRLLNDGYLAERVITVAYPDLTGTYKGAYPLPSYIGTVPPSISVRFALNANNTPPWVTVWYRIVTFGLGEQE